jgi:hypothetical protein
MRRKDRNPGSIKALIVLALLAANIFLALARHTAGLGSAASPPAASRAAREAALEAKSLLAEGAKRAGEVHAFRGQPLSR